MIYLDNAATTKPKEEVMNVIAKSMREDWFNPSSPYFPAFDVKNKIERARETIASAIRARPNEIFFTSSGSEANNLALQGFHKKYPDSHIFISNVEHKSIMECVKHLGDCVHIISVQKDGYINTEDLMCGLQRYSSKENPALVSIQYANNETGVVQDMRDISNIVHSNHAIFHTDSVQVFPHHNCTVDYFGFDMMSVSGHKFGCPKGIGFIYIKNGCNLSPIIYGSQEKQMRGGTENVPCIIGLAKAVELKDTMSNDLIDSNRLYFEEKLKELGCTINCENSVRLENIISCTLPQGCVAELLIYVLSFKQIYISAGSACNSSSNTPSYVLRNIGLTDEEIQRTIRISLSEDTTTAEIDKVIDEIKAYLSTVVG